jgi:short-subunit dehydrogenase
LRAELKPLGIEVLLVSPGSTHSEFWEHLVERQGSPSFQGRAAATEVVARRIVRAIQRGDQELFPTWPARLVSWGVRLCPRLVQWLVARRA